MTGPSRRWVMPRISRVAARVLPVCTLFALIAPAPVRAQEPRRPLSVRDLVAMERLATPRPSPDGARVVFTRRVYDARANKTATNLWLVAIDGSGLRQLTSAQDTDSSPSWSSDGKTIAFISSRGGSSQVWVIDTTGGEARQVTRAPVDVDNVQWSPDGTRLAFSADVYPDCADLACTAKRDKDKEDNPVKARIYTKLMFRHWDAWD